MLTVNKLTQYLDNLLELDKIPDDSSNNGLQLEGSSEVKKIVFGVDACLAITEIAAEKNADFIIVHHGLSWKEGFKRITGNTARTFRTLFKNDISLYGVHLPLDAHSELGHNAQIAKLLGLHSQASFAKFANIEIGVKGKLKKKTSVEKLSALINKKLSATSTVYGDLKREIKNIGIISGGAGSDGIEAAVNDGLDCLVTGEIGHSNWHLIQETNLPVIAAGHYCTEKPGLIAVMNKTQQKFKVKCEFIDLPTGL